MSYYPPPPYGQPYQQVVMTSHVYRSSTAHIVIAWVVAVLTAFYMLPWAIAATRNKSDTAAIALVNLFLGWSVIGWVVTLVWSLTSERASTTVVVQQPVGYPPAPYAPPQQIAPYSPPTQQPYHPRTAIEPTAILPPSEPTSWERQHDPRYDRY